MNHQNHTYTLNGGRAERPHLFEFRTLFRSLVLRIAIKSSGYIDYYFRKMRMTQHQPCMRKLWKFAHIDSITADYMLSAHSILVKVLNHFLESNGRGPLVQHCRVFFRGL
jgi:hypothetical protein